MALEGFLNDNWGLNSEEARRLYHEIAKNLLVIDIHTHFSPEELATNKPLKNAWRAFVFDPTKGVCDHYSSSLAAGLGLPYRFIYDESVPDQVRFQKWAEKFEKMDGTQVHLFTQLELRRLFGIEEILDGKNAMEIYDKVTEALQTPGYSPHAILKKARIKSVATTDDPIDNLAWHRMMKIEGVEVMPTFRPDRAVNIEMDGWKNYVVDLLSLTNKPENLHGLEEALAERHGFFVENGCRATDHGLRIPYGHKPDYAIAQAAFDKAMLGREVLQERDVAAFKSYVMDRLIRMNKKENMITQIHFGIERDVNLPLFQDYGKDKGGDCSTHNVEFVRNLSWLMSEHASGATENDYAKVILYHGNAGLSSTMAQFIRAFPGTKKGTTWWWEDNYSAMKRDFEETVPVIGYSRYSGFVNDGRKLFSAFRSEFCARALCEYAGGQVRNGMLDMEKAQQIVRDVMYNNAAALLAK